MYWNAGDKFVHLKQHWIDGVCHFETKKNAETRAATQMDTLDALDNNVSTKLVLIFFILFC